MQQEPLEDPAVLKRRLKKAVLVAEKLKHKYLTQIEVNKELANRNDILKVEYRELGQTFHAYKDQIRLLEQKIEIALLIAKISRKQLIL